MLGHRKKKLHVLTMVSNPIRFKSRYKLFEKFRAHMHATPGVELYTVEVVFGHRAPRVTEMGNPRHLILKTEDELWHKENALKLLAQRLPTDAQHIAWIDADIEFTTNPKGWARETIEQLQHFAAVQLFQDAIDLGPSGQIIQTHKSFCYQFRRGVPRGPKYEFWHPGFAWAMNRDSFNQIGGFSGIEHAVLGAGDHHLALALIDRAKESVPGGITPQYLAPLLALEDRCRKYIKQDIGYVPGTIHHAFHGKKKDRRYVERWDVLVKNQYNPITDIKPDWQGLWHMDVITPRQIALYDGIRKYFRQRNEDSIDLE